MSNEIESPIISDDVIESIGERYQITIDPDNATQYKLCQVIVKLEQTIECEMTN